MVNYLVMGVAAYIIALKNKILTRREKIFMLGIFISLILPQTYVHVEWRYFYPGYLMAYYLLAYKAPEWIENVIKTEKKDVAYNHFSKLFIWLSFYLIISEMILWGHYTAV